MSLNRRRWSNELLDSLIDFQNRTSSELDDSLNKNEEETCCRDSLDDTCTNGKKNINEGIVEVSSVDIVEEYHEGSMPTLMLSSSETSGGDILSNNISNLTMVEKIESKDCGSTNLFSNFNIKMVENITVSSDGTAKFFSCDSSNPNTIESQSVRSQSTQYSGEIFHEALTYEHEIVIQNKEDSRGQANESNQSNEVCSQNKVGTDQNRFSLNLMSFEQQGEMSQRYFSSPVEYPNLDKELLGEIDHPDIWDALLELDQALSPFGEEENTSENTTEEKQPTPNILSRLSQKFKKTPSRFTEKLISILEDSVISTESPTKHNSGISLHRMTGEFRKLCKFIEDESMPEWAPSMMNMTALCAEKTETPEIEKAQKNCSSETPKNVNKHTQGTPTHRSTPLAVRALLTPKNKIRSRNQTPIKQFTPSADKSFEYWERICNMMCDPSSAEKFKRKPSVVQEDTKLSMDEILTICERQLASLDDSTIDVRTSEPCKKTDSEIKLKVLQAPRSKSVSKMYEACKKEAKSSSKKKQVEKVEDKIEKEEKAKEEKLINLDDTLDDTVLMSDSDNTGNDSSFLRRRVLDTNDRDCFKSDLKQIRENEQNSFDYDYELLRNPKLQEQKSFENDFKLIDYSPQERQSKTQAESSYDPDDPDCSILAELALRRQRCLETAKLMMEIDQEDPMTNDDNKCVETLYKLGIQDKTFAEVEEDTKFLNTLNQCLEYRNYFSDKSKPIIKALQKFDTPEELKKRTASVIRSQSQLSARKPLNKPVLQRTNSAKTLRDGKMTPRLAPSNAAAKLTPRVSRNSSSLRATPRISATTPRATTATPRAMATTPRPMPRSTSKLTPQVSHRTLHPQSEQSKPASKLPTKTPQSLQKPMLRRPILRLSPKTTRKLTPPAELKPCTPRPAQKLTPPSATKTATSKPTPRRVANLKNTAETTDSLPKVTPRPRLFVSPGHSPSLVTLGRKKPASYFSEKVAKSPLMPHKLAHDVKSPIGLYINSVDNDLIQNVHAKTNERLLTPVSYGESGKSPKLKVKLASKENQSPAVHCGENIVLPTVRYHSAQKVCLIDKKSNYSSSITPNSRTKKLLEPIENTVVIRHEGRVVEPQSKTNHQEVETSIRVQKVAEKTAPLRRRHVE